MKIKHLFFDLDKTLWDFDRNSKEVVSELFNNCPEINQRVESVDFYFNTYKEINKNLWSRLIDGSITKQFLRENRFYLTNLAFGLDDKDLGKNLDQHYLDNTPYKQN